MLRLPTKEEFNRLCLTFTKHDQERKGRWFYDEETKEKLFLPCEGLRRIHGGIMGMGLSGFYWASTPYSGSSAYSFSFSKSVQPIRNNNRQCGQSIRLVSDEPFEGAIHVAGLYWKPENEEGYYTYNDAIEKFNVKGK